MNKVTSRLMVFLFLMVGITGISWAQSSTYNVTFKVNTAYVPDTLHATDVVQLRGQMVPLDSTVDYGSQKISWDIHSTTVAQNEGGDYWTVTVKMAPGDTLNYKYWTGFGDTTKEVGTVNNGGWESGDNHQFVLPSSATADSTVALHYYDSGSGSTSPFAQKTDTVGIYFKVDIGNLIQLGEFDPKTDTVEVRGSVNPLTWGNDTGVYIDSAQVASSGANMFYQGVAYFNKDTLLAAKNHIDWKFYVGTKSRKAGWEDKLSPSNRSIDFSTVADTTIHWVFFNDIAPATGQIVKANVNFSVNVGILDALGYFNSAIDSVSLRGGFNSWGEENMSSSSLGNNVYFATMQMNREVGSNVNFKYYVHWNYTRFDTTSSNFLEGIVADNGWEEPATTGGANRLYAFTDQTQQTVAEGSFNGIPPEGLITAANTDGGAAPKVILNIDMNPAMDASVAQPFNPSKDSVYISFETTFFGLTQGITVGQSGITDAKSAASIEKLRLKDPDGDGVYTDTLQLKTPTLNNFGFTVGYGNVFNLKGDPIVWNGGGYDSGRRYYQFMVPKNVGGKLQWPATYTMASLTWSAGQDLAVETPPDYQNILTAISDNGQGNMPNKFNLSQNYPNPFNPTTNISFTLPKTSNVRLTIYNMLGQRVATLINSKMSAGLHSISFDASHLASGMYIYRLKAGNFTADKKMILLK